MATNVDHPYRILITRGCESGKVNSLFNLCHLLNIDKIYLYAKDPYEVKYQLLIIKRENTDLKYLIYSKTFIKYSNYIDDIHKNSEEYKAKNIPRILIVYDDMIVKMPSNKKFNPIVTELFIRGRK